MRAQGGAHGAGLAADDDPVNPCEIKARYRAEQRLKREEPDGGGNGAEAFGPEGVPVGLDADAHPDVRWPLERWRELGEPLRPLREHLIRVLRC